MNNEKKLNQFEDNEDNKEIEDKKETLSQEESMFIQNLESGKIDFEGKIEVETLNDNPKYASYKLLNYSIHPEMGLIINDKENALMIRKIMKFLFMKIGSALFKGGAGIFNISLPLFAFDKVSMLQRMGMLYGYHIQFFNRMIKENDPVEKLKFLTASCIASLHLGIKLQKPFNPILGETFQGKIGDAMIYGEQISHHPPISFFYVKNNNFTFYVPEDYELKTYPNSVVGKAKYKKRLILNDKDKTIYSIKYPTLVVQNILVGKLNSIYTDELIIKDKVNNIFSLIRFNPDKPGFLKGFYNKWFGNQKSTRSDYFRGLITKNKEILKIKGKNVFKSKDIIAYAEGYWIEEIKFNNHSYWEIGKIVEDKLIYEENPLPSDSRYRKDLQEFFNNNIEEAQKQKENLEVIQRNDRKLREDNLKKKEKFSSP